MHTDKTTTRQKAMQWWFNVEYMKDHLTNKYYPNRSASSLTGMEIEKIYEGENKTTTVEQDAKLWWDGLESSQQWLLKRKYFPDVKSKLTDKDILDIYNWKHPSLIEDVQNKIRESHNNFVRGISRKEEGNEVGDKETFARKIRDQFFNAGFENVGDNLPCYCAGGEYAKTLLQQENKTLNQQVKLLREALDNLLNKMSDPELIHYAVNKATEALDQTK